MNVLYSLQHLGYAIPPQADAGWIGEAEAVAGLNEAPWVAALEPLARTLPHDLGITGSGL
jgi:hypothetical protein